MPRQLPLACTCLLLIAAIASSQLVAQDVSAAAAEAEPKPAKTKATTTNPHTSPSDVNQGRNFFRVYCARCHGLNARGAKGPDLTDGVFRHARNDDELYRVIANGIPGTDMAGFSDGTDTTVVLSWQMVAYIRAEEKKRGAATGKHPTGDRARGLALFKKHKCASCHWTGSEGGRRGTDLSRLAAGPDYIRRSLTDPDAQIAGNYQLVQLVMEDGKVYSGRRLYENSYFILIMDEKENLRTISKRRIEKLSRPHKSLMPSFRKFLNSAEVEDLATYILSLRKGTSK
ncbi:MAG: c-type cytochrome [Planctomycetota bacterium]|nr:c-type cytochrome [Planctomycetota bacterium]